MNSSPNPENAESPTELASLVGAYPHGRVPRELRRRQILAVATEAFAERGFAGTSMDEIGRRVGVSKPVLYDLVGSKEQLFHEVVSVETSQMAARVQAAVLAEPDPSTKMRAGSLAFFRFIQERPAWRALVALSDGPVSTELAAARRYHARSVASLIAQGAAETGITLDDSSFDALAHAINGLNEGLALWWNDHLEHTPEALADLATALIGPGLEAFQKQLAEK
ncbi:MAG TPA: TetR/AcrR family transcriptional regulator [Polyangiaceae bacterium]|nr:TetR/AcrR family transcriptional regulator [Polyangiaceae bacterium]